MTSVVRGSTDDEGALQVVEQDIVMDFIPAKCSAELFFLVLDEYCRIYRFSSDTNESDVAAHSLSECLRRNERTLNAIDDSMVRSKSLEAVKDLTAVFLGSLPARDNVEFVEEVEVELPSSADIRET